METPLTFVRKPTITIVPRREAALGAVSEYDQTIRPRRIFDGVLSADTSARGGLTGGQDA